MERSVRDLVLGLKLCLTFVPLLRGSRSNSRASCHSHTAQLNHSTRLSEAGKTDSDSEPIVTYPSPTEESGGMASYRRAELAEEDDSVALNGPPAHCRTVVSLQPPGMWRGRSALEKTLLLILFTFALALALTITLLFRASTTYVIHIDPHDEVCLTPTCVKAAAAVLSSMDPSVDPCHDFYQYACGGWMRENPIPEGKSSWGTFQKLWQQNQLVLKTSLERGGPWTSTGEEKAVRFYESCIDKNETAEKLGPAPLIRLLQEVKGWSVTPSNYSPSDFNFQASLNKLHNDLNMGGLFSWAVGEDDKNSTCNVIQIDQGGLTLPTRDYYLNSTHAPVLDAFLLYMVRVCLLLGAEDANKTKSAMLDVIKFEKEIAKITSPPEDRRDDEKLYHAMSISELELAYPFVKWLEYFNHAFSKVGIDVGHDEMVVVYAPEFLHGISILVEDKLRNAKGKEILNNYMIWHTVRTMTSCLSKPFRDAEKVLRKAILGSEGSEETWRSCVNEVNNNLGFAGGAMFIRERFGGSAKPMAQEMIEEVRGAFQRGLDRLAWMDEETRKLAREKAASITDMIGFPDFILDPPELDKKYEGLRINDSDYFGNNIRVSEHTLIKNLEKLRQPVNKTKWGMTPPTVNAYYSPTSNQMVIPAGILQWPFFHPGFPKSLNYGAIGVVMGHELAHAFDDQGREYDKDGNLHAWWGNGTIEAFKREADCFVRQYSSYRTEGLRVNGKQTLGENMADNGGLRAAFEAYKLSGRPDLPLPGLNISHEKLFFVAFAQVWCSTALKETIVLQIQNDPHVPSPLRVRGPVSNLKEFSDTFGCRRGAEMNPISKCTVW